MRPIPLLRLIRKPRKYPIMRDEYGISARRQAFGAFDRGKRPGEVAQMAEISPRTAYRYFADWKKLPQNLELNYRIARTALKNHPEFSAKTIRAVASHLDISEAEVIERLEKPWGLKQLMMGKWPNYRTEKLKSDREARLEAALKLVVLVEQSGMTLEEATVAIDRLIEEATIREAE